MAQAYSSVLQAQNVDFKVIGRGESSAQAFQQATSLPVFRDGLNTALETLSVPDKAVVAVGVEQLAAVAQQLIDAGCQHILLEKPGALHLAELEALDDAAQAHGAQVWIAYNRRFYSSVKKLRQLVIADSGITSANFEFTEWSHKIQPLQKAPGVKERWLLANSSHVIDLTFALIGLPADGHWQAWQGGTLDWHPAAARFHGAGISQLGIPFSYQADWGAPGRWGLEILTRKHRYLLRPLETLQTISLGSLQAKNEPLEDTLDKRFKPGLYLQCQGFLNGDTNSLCSLKEQINAYPIYSGIAGYSQ